jgi:hypothetical protein
MRLTTYTKAKVTWVECPDCKGYGDNADGVPCGTCNPDWNWDAGDVREYLARRRHLGEVVAEFADKWDTAKYGLCDNCGHSHMVVKIDDWYEDDDNEPDHAWLCAECAKEWAEELAAGKITWLPR